MNTGTLLGLGMAIYHAGFNLRFALETIRYCNLHVATFLDNILAEIG